ncbi:hypothetical protein RFI_06849 [Reticulomyxa filosa]|uniref:TRAF-type domain-containing protein n=1 Tax=Reticulomyxa filosa TaxID=46433 RepID=X6NWL4_RETFI|nr:hypothetical protein RFI_06849 [Reticulomyxa filosa]|eukprot:ETO30273.1 hypothetical protein RFI_06849 [Reticulomyxa filosa]
MFTLMTFYQNLLQKVSITRDTGRGTFHKKDNIKKLLLKKMTESSMYDDDEDDILTECFDLDLLTDISASEQERVKEYLCHLCHKLANHALELSCKEHESSDEVYIFGESCLKKYLQEKNSKCPINNHSRCEYQKSINVRKKVEKMMIQCPKQYQQQQSYGSGSKSVACNFKGRIKEMKKHLLNDCVLCQNTCDFKEFGCDEKVEASQKAYHNQRNMAQHLQMLLKEARRLKMEQLNPRQDRDDSPQQQKQQSIFKLRVTLQNQEKRIEELRQTIEHLQTYMLGKRQSQDLATDGESSAHTPHSTDTGNFSNFHGADDSNRNRNSRSLTKLDLKHFMLFQQLYRNKQKDDTLDTPRKKKSCSSNWSCCNTLKLLMEIQMDNPHANQTQGLTWPRYKIKSQTEEDEERDSDLLDGDSGGKEGEEGRSESGGNSDDDVRGKYMQEGRRLTKRHSKYIGSESGTDNEIDETKSEDGRGGSNFKGTTWHNDNDNGNEEDEEDNGKEAALDVTKLSCPQMLQELLSSPPKNLENGRDYLLIEKSNVRIEMKNKEWNDYLYGVYLLGKNIEITCDYANDEIGHLKLRCSHLLLANDTCVIHCNGLGYKPMKGIGHGLSGCGGGYGTLGSGKQGGDVYGEETLLKQIYCGSGGGGTTVGTGGGNGGGIVELIVTQHMINYGKIQCNGFDGSDYFSGGGGSGGSILIKILNNTGNRKHVPGKIECVGGNNYAPSRQGGFGRIAIYGGTIESKDLLKITPTPFYKQSIVK